MVIFLLPSVGANNAHTTIENVLSQYYHAKDMGESYDFDQAIDGPIAAYLEEKTDTLQCSTQLYGLEKSNYLFEVNSIKPDTKGTAVKYECQVTVRFHYIDSPEITSGYSEVAHVVYDMDKNLIIDLFVSMDDYDQQMRTEEVLGNKSLSNSPLQLSEEIQERQKEYHRKIDLQHDLHYENKVIDVLPQANKILMIASIFCFWITEWR